MSTPKPSGNVSPEARIAELEAELNTVKRSIRKERECALSLLSQVTKIFWGHDSTFNDRLKTAINKINTERPLYDQLDDVMAIQGALHTQSRKVLEFYAKLEIYIKILPDLIRNSKILPKSYQDYANEIMLNRGRPYNDKVVLICDLVKKTLDHLIKQHTGNQNDSVSATERNKIHSLINGVELSGELNEELKKYAEVLTDKNIIISYTDLPYLVERIISVLVKGFNSERDFNLVFLGNMSEHINSVHALLNSNLETNREIQLAARENNSQFGVQLAAIDECVASGDPAPDSVTAMIHEKLSALSNLVKEREDFMEVQDKLMNDLNDIENKIVSIKKDAVQFKTDIGEISQKNKTDSITGLNNRMSFESRYEKDIRKLGKENFSGMSVILADIDAFVRINQKYGDFVGDKILRVLGLTLRKTLNEKDFVARIGSDFFGIITYTRDPATAKATAEKIISAIKSIPFHYKNEKVPVTISAAYKVITEDEPADAVLGSLSETLEKAKRSESAARSSSDEPFARGLLLEG